MRDKIIEDYKILLSIGWMEADEDGNVSVRLGDELIPATIGGKRVILPTREQMKNTNWDNRIGFHPIRESYNLGVSDLLSSLRDQYVSRLNASIGYLMRELIDIAFDQKNQKNLTSEQSQVLNALAGVSASTVSSFKSLLKNTNARNNADQFINIRIQRAGVVGGVTYGRAGLVQFPIYNKLTASKDEPVNGVKISNKDRQMLIKLFEFVLPSVLTGPEAFSVGVSSRGAPFLESLVRATFNVISELVESAKPYMDMIALPSLLQFPKDMGYWIEVFDSKDMVERLASTIPSMSEFTIEEEKPAVSTSSREEPRKEYRKPVEERAEEVTKPEPPAKRAFWSNAFSSSASTLKPTTSTQERSVMAPRPTSNDTERNSERDRREQADRERREQERIRDNRLRQEEADRRREDEDRRRKRDEEDRQRERDRRDRDRDYDRVRDDRDRDNRGGRDRDRDDRDRDDRDRDGRRTTGDVFEDNPRLRQNTRSDSRYDRDDRDRGRGGRVRDIRDRGGRDDRDRDYYDRDRGRSRDRDGY